jgi:2-polyprenyl-6-methoxyphenol hydroxylase-like FAD-dependent oxidoreductase
MKSRSLGNAVVIGGSMAGILAARVLADYFETVTIIERDARSLHPEPRRGVPQGRHAHALLLRGQQTVFRLFPEARRALLDEGAVTLNLGRDMRWFHFGVWKCRYDSALEGVAASRPLIEWRLGEQLRRLPNVEALDGWSVDSVMYDGERVNGVRLRPRGCETTQMLRADLVIDASGRGSQMPLQLHAFGLPRPPESVVKIDVGYATRICRAAPGSRDWKALFIISQPPGKRGALILPLEHGRWIVTLVGMHGDHPPADEPGFLAFAKSLPVPDLYEAIRHAEPLTEITRYGYPTNLRRHYEQLRRFPPGLLVLGDALCSFNPVYGQGMSAASMYADVLQQCLEARVRSGWSMDDLWRSFFPRAAAAADMPWQLATSEDFRHAETQGRRGAAMRFLHWYTSKVQVASGADPRSAERLYEVMHLLKPATALFRPDILMRLASPRTRRAALYAAGVRSSGQVNVA